MWSSSYHRQCRKVRHSGQCSRTCHRHHSSQSGSQGKKIHYGYTLVRLPLPVIEHLGMLTSCLLRSGRRSWGPNSSTNNRCSATQQKRSLGRCKCRSTGLVTDISKCSQILLLCWSWHNTQMSRLDLRRQSPKRLWPRRRWPRSKRAYTWRRETVCELSAGRFQQEACLFSGVSMRHQRLVLKIRPQVGTRGLRGRDEVRRPKW